MSLASTTTSPRVVIVGRPGFEVAPDEAGGKGAALERMIAAGLPVPPTAIVLSSAGFRAQRAAEIRDVLGEHLAGSAELSDTEVDELFAGAVDADLRDEIRSTLQRLGPDDAYAVRSSATAEDTVTASFAGQYRSVLSVVGVDAVVGAIEAVWASLWHRAPVAYRRLAGGDRPVAMAVIVQRMVDAESAGVAFSVDPSGHQNTIRVEAVDGLGESLVSGERTPRVHLVDRVECAAVQEQEAAAVGQAASLALRAEHLFGAPQDVEWAHDGTATWIVQSRPITVEPGHDLDVADEGVDGVVRPDGRYTTAGIAETLPGVLDDLVWTTAGFLLDHALAESVAALGSTALPHDAHAFVVRVRGRSALDLDRMAKVADDLPGGSPEQLEAELLGIDPGGADLERPITKRSLADRLRTARHDLRVLRATRRCRREEAIVVVAIGRLVAQAPDLGLIDERLVALRARLVDLAARATVAEVSVAVAAVAAHGRLLAQLTKAIGASDAARWVDEIIGAGASPAMLARPLEAAALLRDLGVEPTRLDRWEDLTAPDGHLESDAAPVRDIVSEAARKAGCRSVVCGPTWASDLAGFWELVRRSGPSSSEIESRRDDAIERLGRALAATPGWTRTRLLTGQVIDVRRRIVRRLAYDAVDLLDRRERCKAAVLELGGVIRAVDDEIGQRLTRTGALIDAADVRHLRVDELRPMLMGSATPGQAHVLARRRRAERWRSQPGLPRAFSGDDATHAGPVDRQLEPSDPAELTGWPASAGRHTGRARVLDEPALELVEVGDVVVAQRTDASWLPIFLRAGAIVVEQGGPLSHASILARELHLPAVVNVPGVVELLRLRQGRVEVDGTDGRISLRPEVDR